MGLDYYDRVSFDEKRSRRNKNSNPRLLASDALPLPVWLTNRIFIVLFCAASYYLLRRWGEKKVRAPTPLYVLTFGDMVAFVGLIASLIYLLGFFGIDYVQNFIGKGSDGHWDFGDATQGFVHSCHSGKATEVPLPSVPPEVKLNGQNLKESNDEDIACAVSRGSLASHTLEGSVGDAQRAASIRKRSIELITGRSLEKLSLGGFDYSAVVGQCCEMVIGHVQLPVGVAGPLMLDGLEYMVPMATTEGCLVASTNRGCKAIHLSGGATSILLRDGMARAPVVRFDKAHRAAELKFYIEDTNNFDTLSVIFNR